METCQVLPYLVSSNAGVYPTIFLMPLRISSLHSSNKHQMGKNIPQNGPKKCEIRPFEVIQSVFKFFKDCITQTLLGPFLNTLSQILLHKSNVQILSQLSKSTSTGKLHFHITFGCKLKIKVWNSIIVDSTEIALRKYSFLSLCFFISSFTFEYLTSVSMLPKYLTKKIQCSPISARHSHGTVLLASQISRLHTRQPLLCE